MPMLTEENVIAQLQHLRTHPSVASRMANGHLFIHGWVYNIETSEIKAYDADQGRFLPLTAAIRFRWRRPKRAKSSKNLCGLTPAAVSAVRRSHA
jgi:hypothetical protein